MALHFAKVRAVCGVPESTHAAQAYDPHASTPTGTVIAVFR
jgi:hypothetical protein